MTMPQCDHEAADSRILHHVKHALSQSISLIQILSNDTDAIILTFGVYHILRSDHIFSDLVIEVKMGGKTTEK